MIYRRRCGVDDVIGYIYLCTKFLIHRTGFISSYTATASTQPSHLLHPPLLLTSSQHHIPPPLLYTKYSTIHPPHLHPHRLTPPARHPIDDLRNLCTSALSHLPHIHPTETSTPTLRGVPAIAGFSLVTACMCMPKAKHGTQQRLMTCAI